MPRERGRAPMVRIKIHTDTMLRGEPLPAGSIVEVTEDEAARLACRGEVVAPDAPGATPPDEIEDRDPTPHTRDPHPKKKAHR